MSVVVREWTAAGPGGVSVVGVEGEGALARVARIVPRAERLRPGRLVFTELRAAASAEVEVLDEALVHVASSARVELHLHGSPPVVRRVMAELEAELAEVPGNTGLEELAWRRLPTAPSEPCARMLLDQAEGALRRELEALVAVEAHDAAQLATRLDALIENGRVAQYLVQPPRIVLAGPSNAGKSTLFNRLLGVERALVDAQGGTTRDPLRGHAAVGEWWVELVDTAGERELASVAPDSAEEVERSGQRFGRDLRAAADWTAWLDPDPSAPDPPHPAGGPWTRFTSRADELHAAAVDHGDSDVPGNPGGAPNPIATQVAGEEACRVFLAAMLRALSLPHASWSPGRAAPFTLEQREALTRARLELDAGGRESARSILRGLLAP